MRSKLAMLNTFFGIINQIVLAIVNIGIRKVMISTIGVEYLGVGGLFSNVLSLLSLTESGFGIAIVYKLYRPIANNDVNCLGQYLSFYSKVYKVIAGVVTGAGIIILPILPFVIKETSIPMNEIYWYYILFLVNNVASYFIAYKTALLTAYQQNFYVMIINTVTTLIMAIFKIIALILLKNYIIYLLIVIVNTILINVVVSIFANKRYPYLKELKGYVLAEEEKKNIYKDCKAIMFHKVAAYVLTGTDNLLISAFVNVVAVGLYSNYLIVINLINSTLTKLFDAIVPAFGNILATDGEKSAYESYEMVTFFCFLIQTFCTGMLLLLIQPFIQLVFGKDCLLDTKTVFVLVLNFFFLGMRRPAGTMKSASGIFFQDRYWALLEAVLNLVVSILCVQYMGLFGIFVGTIVSGLCIPNLVGPYFLYRDVFRVKFKKYLLKNLEYYCLMFVSVFPIYSLISQHPFANSIVGFGLEVIRSLLIIGTVILFYAYVLPERKFTLRYTRKLFDKIKRIKKEEGL